MIDKKTLGRIVRGPTFAEKTAVATAHRTSAYVLDDDKNALSILEQRIVTLEGESARMNNALEDVASDRGWAQLSDDTKRAVAAVLR